MFFLTERLKPVLLFLLVLGIFLLAGPLPAWADDVDIIASFDGIGIGSLQESEHYDANPWKGWLDLTVTNNGNEAWGDFHFGIFQIPGQGPVDNVDFIVTTPYEPTSTTQSGLSWSLGSDGSTLDLYFYSDPVLPTETAYFKVYTDNTTDQVNFGVFYYPTAVPIPSAVWLLGSGLIGLIGFRRKCRE